MTNYFTKEETQLREKQHECPHPSFKCSLCGKYKDNLFCEYRAEIEILRFVLDQYENLLDDNQIVHNKYKEVVKSGKIREIVKIEIGKYYSNRRDADNQY